MSKETRIDKGVASELKSLREMKKKYEECRETYGSPRVHEALQRSGLSSGNTP